MQAKARDPQQNLYEVNLGFLCDEKHPLIRLSSVIEWSEFDKTFGALYSEQGRPAKPTRLMVGLHYLKHAHGLSDEEVVSQWVENPYWQYFCGELTFQHELPIDPSSMTRWRKRLKSGNAVLLGILGVRLPEMVLWKNTFHPSLFMHYNDSGTTTSCPRKHKTSISCNGLQFSQYFHGLTR